VCRVVTALWARPVLDREYVYLVSLFHQLAVLRAKSVRHAKPRDVLSAMFEVPQHHVEGSGLVVRMEPEAIEAARESITSWGGEILDEEHVRIRYREDYTREFIASDGTPLFRENPEEPMHDEIELLELVRMQISNDAFLLGVLENPKATSRPGIVPTIALHSRSLRVLDKILRTRSLWTGPANKDVPRLLLLNPSRVPSRSLATLIHVRYVPKNDLIRLSRPHSEVRPEVRKEIETYLKSIQA
jgi:hypothetical protein